MAETYLILKQLAKYPIPRWLSYYICGSFTIGGIYGGYTSYQDGRNPLIDALICGAVAPMYPFFVAINTYRKKKVKAKDEEWLYNDPFG